MSDTDEVQPLSWEVIAKMTREEYDRRRAEIIAWLLDHPARRQPERAQGTPVNPRPRWHILWDRHSEK